MSDVPIVKLIDVDTGRPMLYRLAVSIVPNRGEGWSAETLLAYTKAAHSAADRQDFPGEIYRGCVLMVEDGRLCVYVELHDTHPLAREVEDA